ncbi:4-hydroxyphenylacetate degradation bifunctional isomerase/decarboxylase, C-terminal subunit [Budvicia aquatica]|uniref:4-hydroxyphenylacetate degradation bifunctional isomerase/decarboxylase, C-terminal subunit n=1 Tax=Budvicia aquatica TaxID=82979 RepID=A0A484ZWK8_9GAMM|nr:4-hydroxyphenylacetate degradation bifunctional isomerase/decarboxylase, C-terminal subunit [Budvicia aquatica]
MKHARIQYQGQPHQVTIDGQEQAVLSNGSVLAAGTFDWLPPAEGTVFALGLNYADHCGRA